MAMAQSTPIGRIDPSSLIGQADPDIVSPRAVATLTDAFRSGQISANDIHDRVSERAKAKEKMEITLANRATAEAEDPALQEARRQQMLAAGAQGQLAGAQATAGLANVNEIEQLKLQMAQNAAQVQKYPMSTKFPELAAKYSVPTPRNPDGSLDYAALSDLGSKLVAHDAKIENAKSVWNSISKERSADNTKLIRGVTHQGVRLSDEDFKAAEDATKESFFKVAAPGAVVAPVVTAAAPPDLRSAGEGDTPETSSIVVEPRATTPAAAAALPTVGVDATSTTAGTTSPSGDLELGPNKETGAGAIKMTGEQAAQLSKGGFTVKLFENFRNTQEELQKQSPWLTGPIAGTVASVFFSHKWDVPTANFESAKTAIMAPMVKGIFQETGVLSKEDITRYNKTLPSIDQTPAVQKLNIDNLERYIYESIVENYKAMEVQGQDFIKPGAKVFYDEARQRLSEIYAGGPSIADLASGAKPTAAAPATAAAAPVVALDSGKKLQRNAQGAIVRVP